MQVVLLDIHSVKQNFAVVWIIEAHHEIYECALSTSRLADEGYGFIWIDGQSEASEYKFVLSGRIPEPNILEFDLTSN